MKNYSPRTPNGKRVRIPMGTEQETGLTSGETEIMSEEVNSTDKAKSNQNNKLNSIIIPAGTQQETGLTIGQTDMPSPGELNENEIEK